MATEIDQVTGMIHILPVNVFQGHFFASHVVASLRLDCVVYMSVFLPFVKYEVLALDLNHTIQINNI